MTEREAVALVLAEKPNRRAVVHLCGGDFADRRLGRIFAYAETMVGMGVRVTPERLLKLHAMDGFPTNGVADLVAEIRSEARP